MLREANDLGLISSDTENVLEKIFYHTLRTQCVYMGRTPEYDTERNAESIIRAISAKEGCNFLHINFFDLQSCLGCGNFEKGYFGFRQVRFDGYKTGLFKKIEWIDLACPEDTLVLFQEVIGEKQITKKIEETFFIQRSYGSDIVVTAKGVLDKKDTPDLTLSVMKLQEAEEQHFSPANIHSFSPISLELYIEISKKMFQFVIVRNTGNKKLLKQSLGAPYSLWKKKG